MMDRWSTQQKKGKLTDAKIKGLINKWHDQRREGDLNQAVVDREMKKWKPNWRNTMRTSWGRYQLRERMGQ